MGHWKGMGGPHHLDCHLFFPMIYSNQLPEFTG